MRLVVALSLAVIACGGRAAVLPSGAAAPGNEVTLYRDRAIIKHRLDVVVPEASAAIVTFELPARVALEDVAIIEHGTLTVSDPKLVGGTAKPVREPDPCDFEQDVDPCGAGDIELDVDAPIVEPSTSPAPDHPSTITFEVRAPEAGRYALSIGYVTDRITWDAAYTMTTTPSRTHASLRGAVAVRNRLGIALPSARTYLVDTEIGTWRDHMAEQLGSAVLAAGKESTIEPRLVGELALGVGETRIEMLAGDAPREMHSVLVYDPIGTKLDNTVARPLLDSSLGIEPASPRVTESLEVRRPRASSEGLPGGPVRLLERRADGSLAVLGESRLFDSATRVAAVDTIAIGTADKVTGARERRELTYDEDNRRVVEEFVLTIDNQRAHPVEVVLREHLYRGQNWRLAYQTASAPTKEGPQQISLRMIAPAQKQTKVLYVVVYTGL